MHLKYISCISKNTHFECCEKGSTANRESDIIQ